MLFRSRWDSRPVRTFVEGVKDDVNVLWIESCEHLLETSSHYPITRFFFTIVVHSIKPEEDVAARTGLSRKLDEEGGKEVATMLFIKVPEVEVKVRRQY